MSLAFAQRELTDIPVPDPELKRATFQVDDGWNVSLFAADPTMAKPIHMNWDNHTRRAQSWQPEALQFRG